MLQFTCPHCNQALQIPDKYAGSAGKCKKCGKGITAPGVVPGAPEEVDPFAPTDLESLKSPGLVAIGGAHQIALRTRLEPVLDRVGGEEVRHDGSSWTTDVALLLGEQGACPPRAAHVAPDSNDEACCPSAGPRQ